MLTSPFSDESIEEVHLPNSPLERVIAQVVLPRLGRLSAAFQDVVGPELIQHLLDDYPFVEEGHEVSLTITPAGVNQERGSLVRVFRSVDRAWTATIGETSIALDTTAYTTRPDFIVRFSKLLRLVGKVLDIPSGVSTQRIGVRYVNRITDRDLLLRANTLVRPQALGGQAVHRPEHVKLIHTMSDSLYVVGDRQLQARWGLLPTGQPNGPGLAGLPAPSWILDLDSYSQEAHLYDPDNLAAYADSLAFGAYRYFRWLVTDDFLRAFGGDV